MDEEITYSGSSISIGGGAATTEGDMVGRDKITIQVARGVPDIRYTPEHLVTEYSPDDSPEMHKRLEDLRTAIDRDRVLGFKEKSELAGIVESVSYELYSSQRSLERVREMMRQLKSVTGEEHQTIVKAADAIWNYIVDSEAL